MEHTDISAPSDSVVCVCVRVRVHAAYHRRSARAAFLGAAQALGGLSRRTDRAELPTGTCVYIYYIYVCVCVCVRERERELPVRR